MRVEVSLGLLVGLLIFRSQRPGYRAENDLFTLCDQHRLARR